MTLNEIIKIQSVIDNRSIASDTINTLNNKFYYSKSKGVNIAIGDMHIDHFLRAFKIDDYQKKSVQDETQEIINQQKKMQLELKGIENSYKTLVEVIAKLSGNGLKDKFLRMQERNENKKY